LGGEAIHYPSDSRGWRGKGEVSRSGGGGYPQEKRKVSAESLRKKILYNKAFLLKRYPELKEHDLNLLVEEGVRKAIQEHLTVSGGVE
jgi:hypothetical protein